MTAMRWSRACRWGLLLMALSIAGLLAAIWLPNRSSPSPSLPDSSRGREVEPWASLEDRSPGPVERGSPTQARPLEVTQRNEDHAAIELLVTSTAEEPIAGLEVSAMPMKGDACTYADVVPATTDAAGSATFAPVEGASEWYVSTALDGGRTVWVAPEGTTKVAIALAIQGLSGLVTDAAGQPVGGALLWAAHLRGDSVFACTLGRADDEGRFAVPHTGRVSLLGASADGYSPSRPLELPLSPAVPDEIRLVLPSAGARLAGQVIASGSPAAGAVVELAAPTGFFYDPEAAVSNVRFQAGPPRLTFFLRTDADGAFEVDLPPGVNRITVRAPRMGVHSEEVDLVAGENRPLEIFLDEAVRIFGRVRNQAGHPVGGARLVLVDDGSSSALGSVGVTAADGTFSVWGGPIAAGTRVAVDGGQDGWAETVVPPSVRQSEWNPVVGSTRDFRGCIVTDRGAVVAECFVQAVPEDGYGPYRTAMGDGSGCFLVEDARAGPYSIRISLPWLSEHALHVARNVWPRDGAVTITIPEERLQCGRIRLSVVDLEGRPMPSATVFFERASRDPSSGVEVVAGHAAAALGSFESPPLSPDPYLVLVEADGFAQSRIGPVELEPNGYADLGLVELQRGQRVMVELEVPGDQPVHVTAAVIEIGTRRIVNFRELLCDPGSSREDLGPLLEGEYFLRLTTKGAGFPIRERFEVHRGAPSLVRASLRQRVGD